MGDPEQPRSREQELERQLSHLLVLIDHYSGSDAAHEIAVQLNRVIGQWRTTLVWRDRWLYRPIAAGPDHGKAMLAAACQDRMDALAEQVEDFARCWSSSAIITSAFPRFRSTALVLVAAIETRLDGDRRLLGETPLGPAARRMVA